MLKVWVTENKRYNSYNSF